MRLREGRLGDIVATNRARGTLLVCHQTTYGQQVHEVVCRGYYDAYGAETNVVRVMTRIAALDGYATAFQQVDPDDEEDPDDQGEENAAGDADLDLPGLRDGCPRDPDRQAGQAPDRTQ